MRWIDIWMHSTKKVGTPGAERKKRGSENPTKELPISLYRIKSGAHARRSV